MSNNSATPPPEVQAAAATVKAYLDQQTPRLSEAELADLSPAERIDYCRRFDQSTMPAWQHPKRSAKRD